MSSSSEWTGEWSRSQWCKGPGLIIEGIIKSSRMHSIFLKKQTDKSSQEDQLPTRFIALIVEVENACKRNFDQYGVELPPKTVRAKAVSKGYLNNFEKLDASLIEKLSSDQILSIVGAGSGKPLPPGFHDPGQVKLHPQVPNVFEFWADTEKFSHKDVNVGDSIRLKTVGDSVFIESFAKLDRLNVPHFSGDAKLGESWTNKIMSAADKNLAEPEGVDDDEWND